MTILERIMQVKRSEVARAQADVPASELRKRLEAALPPRDFVGAIRARVEARQPAVIAEIKRASPSKGLLREDFSPADIARSYAGAGATCLSVLTDREFFQGAPEHLGAAREACALPVLRKDFVFDPYQVMESRALGADCILLIAACLSTEEMKRLELEAQRLGMAVLVEVHDRAELDRALRLQTPLLGINNRNLHTFETRIETTLELLPLIPPGPLVVSESGFFAGDQVRRVVDAGARAVLVGEGLVRALDLAAKIQELRLAGGATPR
jgi:indole-3-glycerol phosphate synthase